MLVHGRCESAPTIIKLAVAITITKTITNTIHNTQYTITTISKITATTNTVDKLLNEATTTQTAIRCIFRAQQHQQQKPGSFAISKATTITKRKKKLEQQRYPC